MQNYATQILSQSINAVVIIDEENRITFFNAAAELLWGHKATKVLGRNVSFLVPEALKHIHDDYINANRETKTDKIVGTSRDVELERADGFVIWANLSMSRIVQGGKITYAAFLRDVDEEYRNRERIAQLVRETTAQSTQLEDAAREALVARRQLEEAIAALDDGFVLWDERDRLVIWNSTWEVLMGPVAQHLERGASFEALATAMAKSGIVPQAVGREDAFVAELLSERTGAAGVEKIFQSHLGTWIRQKDKRTTSGSTVGLRIDVSEMKQREIMLEEAQNRAEAANRAKSNFLANMSHEIRTPLNGIIGMTEVLSESALDADQRECAQTILDSSGALLRIINDILDFSKIEAEKITLREEPFSLRGVVQDVVSLLRPKAVESGIEICVDIPGDVPETLMGDSGRIRQVLVNLVGNALKFTSEGHVGIEVHHDPNRTELPLSIAVIDTGLGIPQDKLHAVFSAFEQVEDEKTRQFEGTGLGLAITRRIITLMGGKLGVTSTEGVGSTFLCNLNLPVVMGQPAAPALLPDTAVLRGKRVVIVDDLEMTRRVLRRCLSAWGMEVTCLPDGESFLRQMANGAQYELAIFDHHMPSLSGEALLQTFRAAFPDKDLPVILYSSSFQSGPSQNGWAAGFDEIVLKPARLKPLATALIRALGAEDAADTAWQNASATSEAVHDLGLTEVDVLVVEDNRTNQLVIRKMLQQTGCVLRFANNGALGIAAFREKAPDVILMDVSMPVMGGMEATRRIRALEGPYHPSPCPIIALTANAMRSDQDACLAAGMTDFLSKPIRKDDLLDHLRAALAAPARSCTTG